MISTPTVLVLGAGASAPFGFPVGNGLRQRILRDLRDDQGGAVEWLRNAGYDLSDIRRFRGALLYSGKESVDAFLEHRTDCIEVGKAAIAQALIPCEQIGALFNEHTNLYSYLFRRLNAPLDKFGNNRLSIVTYNYDRSFEHYLFMALKNSFRLDDKRAAELVNAIPVVHVHGHLGDLPWQKAGGRDYTGECQPDDIRNASRTIKIIHEAVEGDPEFRKAHELIEGAELLVFLGFGYDATNVGRLKINFGRESRCQIFGTYFGFTQVEITAISSHLFQGRLTFGQNAHDALQFLREMITLS